MQPHQGVESMTTQANIQAATEYLINDTHPNIRRLETPCVPNHSSACRPGAKNTRENACTEGGCYKRRRDSVTLFCAAHAKENKCSKRDCEEIRVPDGQLCKKHTCDEPGCLLEVYPQGQNGKMCSQHQPCDVGASLHDWKDPISARITHAAIEGAGMLPHVQEAVVSSTTVGGTTSLTAILMIPTAADDTDKTSRDAMPIPEVLDGSALATAVYEERKKNKTKTTGTISLEGEMSGMSALDIVGNDGMMGSTSRPHGGMGSRQMFHDNLGTLGMQRI
ncbi:hypothetical protein BHE90_006911 [Fusarium euwallaceae]|uniref:Uncharacterized protein n=1 Tax=Fusarium euwallaceae TaxID=1147111 RepID=A0A430LSA3_9HYPO|nr:hypothetical protein BHE90_006911 [Fusarium euwallaceae]